MKAYIPALSVSGKENWHEIDFCFSTCAAFLIGDGTTASYFYGPLQPEA